ncbi:ABC transporter permease [candidate division CSSED10-310 bacterium]|uniref:ABC transporter permease n=1 Tax=candidate division CSSED10-310 bacterium TaxID=2855610 RepID=A0ABV6YUL5_UNCC1
MKNYVSVVFRKEVLDNLRDRRALGTALMIVLIGPIMALLMIYMLGNLKSNKMDKPLDLQVSGAHNAPSLIHYLKQNDVNILAAPDDAQTAIKNGESDVVLFIPDNYAATFTSGEPAPLKLMLDSSRSSAKTSIVRTKQLILGYSRQIGNLRLLARGINPQIASSVTLETMDLATPQSKAMFFLLSLPMFLIMTLFIGGMAVTIDTTAGERERGSLEPLLINPTRRWEIVTGKLLAVLVFTTVTIILSIFGFALIFNYVPIDRILDIPVNVNWTTFVLIFLTMLPLILFAAALQMVIVTFARSYKEAQTTLAWLPMIPMLPGMVLGFMSIQSTVGLMLIPTIGQQLLILKYLRGETIALAHPIIAAGFTLLIAIGLVWLTIRLYSREQLLSEG